MMASTARIIGSVSSFQNNEEPGSLSARSSRFRLDRELREVEIGPAAHAHRVVELDELAAVGALAAELVAVGAVQQGDEQPDHGHDRADDEPDEERGTADAPDQPGREAEPEREREVDHSRRTAQTTA